MEQFNKKAFIAARAARELQNGDVVNLGIGLPSLIPSYLPNGVQLTLQSENGIIGTGATPAPEEACQHYYTDAGGSPAIVSPTGCYIDSASSFALIRGGHVDCCVLGALQVDEEGNLANWIIPGKKLPGMGGAMDLVVGTKRVIIAMEHTANGSPKILRQCTLPLTAVRCVNLIITEMAVIEVTPGGLLVREYNPAYTREQIQAATEASLQFAQELRPMV